MPVMVPENFKSGLNVAENYILDFISLLTVVQ